MNSRTCRFAALALLLPFPLGAQSPAQARVGPPSGTVIVVGGGQLGPEIYAAFIKAAGGPDALIVDVPTAGGAATYAQDWTGAAAWRTHGARNVVVLHTTDRTVANSDSFPAILSRAGGVWFDGGRQYRLVDAYLGTRTEQAFHQVLARGGVVGGSSAGATILGDFLVRGAPSNDNSIMDDPRYEKGFAFLKGVAIDQHVVARERLADLADSIVPKHPELFPISEDEGTAWVVRGDTARIIGAGAAFAYQAAEHDPGKPFLTLHPGDLFGLADRRVVRRAADGTPITSALLDSLFARYARGRNGGATVLAALGGAVLADASYGVEQQPKYMPTTTVPLFDLGAIAAPFHILCDQLPPVPRDTTPAPPEPPPRAPSPAFPSPRYPGAEPGREPGREPAREPARERLQFTGRALRTPFQRCLARSIAAKVGMHHTIATDDGTVGSSVDDLYRFARGLDLQGTAWGRGTADSVAGWSGLDPNLGWRTDSVQGHPRYSAFGTPEGKLSAIERVPGRGAVVIVLTEDGDAPARAIADRLMTLLLGIPAPASP